MWGQRIAGILKGLIGGGFVGLFVGLVVSYLTIGYVVQRSDYIHPVLFEMAESRFRLTLILSFCTIFAVMGPFLVSVSFGPWLRHAVYGLLGGVALVVGIALVGALVEGEQPFINFKGSERTWIDEARGYGLPAAFVFGPFVGILIGRYWKSGGRGKSAAEIKSV
ncbi:hypothetical protein [Gimesia panareensis]|uniref:hypothetical protein n=1 Tax=Gimesia panareensis TaxID=2527978 RepID=UPI00118A8275|nr:hypothetical protein [Gimesia panareensis]QDU50442.1 hypothetical protein Pan110_27880 [Gimesia panareensis]